MAVATQSALAQYPLLLLKNLSQMLRSTKLLTHVSCFMECHLAAGSLRIGDWNALYWYLRQLWRCELVQKCQANACRMWPCAYTDANYRLSVVANARLVIGWHVSAHCPRQQEKRRRPLWPCAALCILQWPGTDGTGTHSTGSTNRYLCLLRT